MKDIASKHCFTFTPPPPPATSAELLADNPVLKHYQLSHSFEKTPPPVLRGRLFLYTPWTALFQYQFKGVMQ